MPSPLAITQAEDTGVPIVVQSHLRWDFVWQRPQQILSRLSESHRVLFIEEPMYLDDVAAPSLALTLPMPRIHRAVPILPATLRDRYDESIAVVRELVRAEMASGGALAGEFERPIQWFYTPMPAPAMIGAFDERAVVYDCMDELSKFRFAPTALVDRERLLLASASVVFTGGHRLSQSKRKLHDNVHFFGCGVDVEHFAQARDRTLAVPEAIASLGKPVMGYYGVIDERIDYELLAKLSAAFPDVALVMIGPVVKVDPRELPQAPNIHWLGQRQYDELPAHLKGFDVCLMPFALNEATEFINPTKTLEYMAAAKPVVSTAISDVLHHFADAAEVGTSHDEFIAAVGRALEKPDSERIARGLAMACNSTWERVVSSMMRIVREAMHARETRTSRVAASAELLGTGTNGRRGARSPRIGLMTASEGSGD
jgi:glycosyltransferase involved in cell wall biosynthesis